MAIAHGLRELTRLVACQQGLQVAAGMSEYTLDKL